MHGPPFSIYLLSQLLLTSGEEKKEEKKAETRTGDVPRPEASCKIKKKQRRTSRKSFISLSLEGGRCGIARRDVQVAFSLHSNLPPVQQNLVV